MPDLFMQKKRLIKYNILFNFSASFMGGGLKRLIEYSKWFDNNGGAIFIIHENCNDLQTKYKNNKYYIVKQNKIVRLVNDCAYLKNIVDELGYLEAYYSYGIPIYQKIAKLNWFHLSNVLPILNKSVPLPIFRKLEIILLGIKIKNNTDFVDVVSAESEFSINLVKKIYKSDIQFFVSRNGSDDELAFYLSNNIERKDFAVVVGTYPYKRVEDSFKVFSFLKKYNCNLKLVIIGDESNISSMIKKNRDVIITGNVPHDIVINYLKISKYYISNTIIENSYNAASEGVFLAQESYISDIPPHHELLKNTVYNLINISDIKYQMIHVKRENISQINIESWDEIIAGMISFIYDLQKNNGVIYV